MPSSRTERDLLGARTVPGDAYWGIHSLRAQENFAVSGRTIGRHPHLVRALAAVKQAAAETNATLGVLDADRAAAIVAACVEIRDGALHDQFVVDVVQGGAGTSTNMNANEVIANRALEHLGRPRGDYAALHPNEHVNLGQSTNDVYPTAVRIALLGAADELLPALDRLIAALARQASAFADAVKLGRTQLQDAVPITLGRELAAHATLLGASGAALREACGPLHRTNLGGTAIGTGIAAPAGYAGLVHEQLARITGLPLAAADDRVAATQDTGAFVRLSAATRGVAVTLSRLGNDLRLLASGPEGGFGELRLPAVQAGSSLMPGKVNPVIPELVNQVAFETIGRDLTVTFAAEAGQLELNAFEPTIFRAIDTSLDHLRTACDRLAVRCIDGLQADRRRMRAALDASPVALMTALTPHIGYDAATGIAKTAASTGRSVPAIVVEQRLLTEQQLATVVLEASRDVA